MTLAIGAIDLRMEGEIGREPLAPATDRRGPASSSMTKARSGRLAALVGDAQRDLGSTGERVNSMRRVVAKPDVLRALPDVDGDRRFALSGIAAVELKDAVLDLKPGERRRSSGGLSNACEIEPAVGDVAVGDRLRRASGPC